MFSLVFTQKKMQLSKVRPAYSRRSSRRNHWPGIMGYHGDCDLSHATKWTIWELLPPQCWFFGAQRIKTYQNHRTSPQFVRSTRTQKPIKRTQKSPKDLKFQNVYVCDFQLFSVYGQNGVEAPRLMGYIMKDARCSGSTATYQIGASYQPYYQLIAMLGWFDGCGIGKRTDFPRTRSNHAILIQMHQNSEQTQTLKIKQDFEAPGMYNMYIYIYRGRYRYRESSRTTVGASLTIQGWSNSR